MSAVSCSHIRAKFVWQFSRDCGHDNGLYLTKMLTSK